MPADASLTNPARLTVPAQAAYELDSLGKTLGSLAERLGHDICISGDLCVVQFSNILDEPTATDRQLETASA